VAKGGGEVGPEVTCVGSTLPGAGKAERLAGVAAADEVDGFNVAPVDLRDVSEVRDVRPVLRQHPGRVRVDLGLPADGHPGPLEAEVETADAGEQRADG
jgi:hypothetical protein